jgi:putative FmdB family regulatory protein
VPTYQYACTECGEQLEAVQKFTDDPLTVCETCGGRLRKVFSPVGIVFKGSGFYRTDSRNGSGSSPAKDKPAGASAPGSGESGPADKPAAKKPAEVKSSSGEKAA